MNPTTAKATCRPGLAGSADARHAKPEPPKPVPFPVDVTVNGVRVVVTLLLRAGHYGDTGRTGGRVSEHATARAAAGRLRGANEGGVVPVVRASARRGWRGGWHFLFAVAQSSGLG